MKKKQNPRRMFGLAAALIVGGLALSGCTSTDEAPVEEPDAQQEQPQPDEQQPDEEELYGVMMPTLRDDMDANERAYTERMRLVKVATASETRIKIKNRLDYIWKVADPTTLVWGQSESTADGFADAALDMAFKTVEGACLADELDEQQVADYAASLQSSAEVRFDGSEPGEDVYWLHRAYQDLPHDEALEKTDALYRAIEDTGCLVLEGPKAKIRPEMVPGWNH